MIFYSGQPPAFAALTGLSANNEGQYVQIINSSTPVLIGQVRRISTGGYGTPANGLTVENPFISATGVATVVPSGTTFRLIRAAIGPFFVKSYDAANKKITTSGRNSAAAQPSSFTVGSPTFYSVGATPISRYGDPQNGPCYIHIISGAGAGQIRRIVDGTGVVPIAAEENEIELTEDFAVVPAANSQFVVINAVPKNTTGTVTAPTATGGAGTGEGAYGLISGASGLANQLQLFLRPGWGEPTTGGTTTVDVNTAGIIANVFAQWDIAVHSGLNINALVNGINLGTATSDIAAEINGKQVGTGVENGQWVARVGLGRDGASSSDRFDWFGGDTLNGPQTNSDGPDCLCDFASTPDNPATQGDYGITPNRYHRFVDNLALFVDTINSQSSLITAARSTEMGTPGGGDFGMVFLLSRHMHLRVEHTLRHLLLLLMTVLTN